MILSMLLQTIKWLPSPKGPPLIVPFTDIRTHGDTVEDLNPLKTKK